MADSTHLRPRRPRADRPELRLLYEDVARALRRGTPPYPLGEVMHPVYHGDCRIEVGELLRMFASAGPAIIRLPPTIKPEVGRACCVYVEYGSDAVTVQAPYPALIDNAQSKELVEGLNFCVLVRFNVWAILNVPATLPPTSGLAVESASLANDLLVNTDNPSWADAVTLSWTSTADEKLIVSGTGYAGGGGGSHAAFVQLTVDDTPIAPTESGTGAHLATSEIYAKNMSLTRHVAVAAGDHTAKVKVSKQSGYGSWTLHNGYTLEVYRFGA